MVRKFLSQNLSHGSNSNIGLSADGPSSHLDLRKHKGLLLIVFLIVLDDAYWNLKHMRKWLAWSFGWTDSGRYTCCYEGHKTRKHNLCHKFLSIPSLFLLFFLCFQHHFLLTIVGYQSHDNQQSNLEPSVAAGYEISFYTLLEDPII